MSELVHVWWGSLGQGKVQLRIKRILQRCVPLLLFEFHLTLEKCIGSQLVPSGCEGYVSCNSAFSYFQLQKV